MKRSYPYTGPRPQAQGAQQPGYGQPPPPAGPAPPLPSSGPPPPAYANYGYGAAAPVRQPAAPPMSGAGAYEAQQPQWNQQWQQPYPAPPAATSTQGPGPYNAPRPPAQPQHPQPGPYNQVAGYGQHQTPMQYPYQAPAPSMRTQNVSQNQAPFAPNAHGYTPPAPQQQQSAQVNAQNWPGAYVNGGPSGPPNKKARYQASSGPSPASVSPFVPPGVPAANMAGGAMGPFPGSNPANAPLQPPYTWQGPPAPSASPVNQQQGPIGRVSSGSGVHANAQARGGPSSNRQQGGKAGRHASGNMSGQGLNRNGPNGRGNMPQRQAPQRAGLPANPNVAANAARPQNGSARAWGTQGTESGSAQTGAQAGRRGSTASSVQSDKNSKRPDKSVGGSVSKPGFSSQNTIPLSAPRGPSGAKNKGERMSSLPGGAASAQADAEGPGAGKCARFKPAHTDFRIVSLEIKDLGWSWLVQKATPRDEEEEKIGVDQVKNEPVEIDDTVLKMEDGAEATLAGLATEDGTANAQDTHAEEQKNAEAEAAAVEAQRDDQGGDAHHDQDHGDASAEPEHDDKDYKDGYGDSDADADVDVDVEADADADADPEDDADADGDADADANAEVDGTADTAEDAAASQADTDSALPQAQQHSDAPSADPPKGPKADAGKAKLAVQLGESTKLRFCFAAIPNAGPEGAPTGPKIEQAEQTATTPNTSNEHDAIVKDEKQDDKGKRKEKTEEADAIVSEAETKVEDAPAADPEKAEEPAASKPDEAEAAAPKTDSKASAKGPPQLSLNRIFLSYASNRKRLAIDAGAVSSVQIHRSEGWIELRLSSSFSPSAGKRKGDEYFVYPGVLLEQRDKGKGQESYAALTRAQVETVWKEGEEEERGEVPPFHNASGGELVIRVELDERARLPEPSWVRKNALTEFLREFARSTGDGSGHVWAGKIEVCDPDPPRSMATVLGEWVKESGVGSEKERRNFVDDLLGKVKKEGETDDDRHRRVARGLVELVSRLVRGERVAPTTPLLKSALDSASVTTTATYPGLVLLGLVNHSLTQPGVDVAAVREHVDAICMEIPKPTLVKAIDLTFKDVLELSSAAAGGGGGGRKQHHHPGHNHNHNHNPRSGGGKRKRH